MLSLRLTSKYIPFTFIIVTVFIKGRLRPGKKAQGIGVYDKKRRINEDLGTYISLNYTLFM